MMLDRKLRKDRHPQHAGEVRENIVPRMSLLLHTSPILTIYQVYSGLHRSMDQVPPSCTLFPHEDILLRTFAYEQDLLEWRVAELEAGRPDPGRPSYDEVSGDINSSLYRVLCLTSPLGVWRCTHYTTSLSLQQHVRPFCEPFGLRHPRFTVPTLS
jgi:hypothetical protein